MADEQGREPIEIVVTREPGWWLGLPTRHPGSCIGATVAELMDEAWRIMPYMAEHERPVDHEV